MQKIFGELIRMLLPSLTKAIIVKDSSGTCEVMESRFCGKIISEPNAPSILAYLGCRRLICGKSAVKIRVYGVDGYSIEILGLSLKESLAEDSNNVLEAELPLELNVSLGTFITSPSRIEHVYSLNTLLCGEKYRSSMMVDTIIPASGFRCKVKLYCKKIPSLEQLDNRKCLNILYPYAYIPRTLTWVKLRIRKHIDVDAPWICVGSPRLGYMHILCVSNTDEGCSFAVTPRGTVELIEGKAVAFQGNTCSPADLYIAYLHGLAVSQEKPNIIPCIWSRTKLLPLSWLNEGGSEIETRRILMLVWNPFKSSRLHVITLEKHRILSAKLITPDGKAEELIPQYNMVKVPMPPHGVRVLRLEVKRIPPLLGRK